MLDTVRSEERLITRFRQGDVGSESVEINTQYGRVNGFVGLCQQTGNHSREHVAGSGSGQGGVSGRVFINGVAVKDFGGAPFITMTRLFCLLKAMVFSIFSSSESHWPMRRSSSFWCGVRMVFSGKKVSHCLFWDKIFKASASMTKGISLVFTKRCKAV